jgi:NADPH:quinone reductase-like Zn-dependent oxidoreductase
LEEAPTPAVDERTALVRVIAASINPSDVKNVAGAMKQTTLPRVPGRDYSGVVESGPDEWIGAEVWGTGGDVGFTRDGSHAQLIAVPAASLRRKPETLSFDQAASVGVNFMAAWCGLETAGLKAGETALLIGSGGGVGGAAAQIARRLGARALGADRRAPHPDAPIRAIASKLFIDAGDLPAEVRAATNGEGADVVFDMVGGVMFRSALNCLAVGGRLVEIAAMGQREVSFDLADFYHNESRLFGVDTLKRDLTASAEALDALTPGFASGEYRPAPIAETCGLGQAQEAYRKVAAGAAGRIVLRPQEEAKNGYGRLSRLPVHGLGRRRGLRPRSGPLARPAAHRARRPFGHGSGGAGGRHGETSFRASRPKCGPRVA